MGHLALAAHQALGYGPPLNGAAQAPIARYVGIGFVGFAVAAVVLYFAAAGATGEAPPAFAPHPAARPQPDGTFLMTVDTKDPDRWVALDLSRGRISDEAHADLMVKRYVVRAPGGAVDLGPVALDAARLDPSATWQRDRLEDGDLRNPALDRWYDYSYWTHLLSSKGRTYAVRLASGAGVAYLRVESYYCEPEGSGCFTVRYRLELGN